MSQRMRSHIFELSLILLLTGCGSHPKKECSAFITVEAQHAKDLNALVIPQIGHALEAIGYEKQWSGVWLSDTRESLIKFKNETENPFVVNLHLWNHPGSYASCNIATSLIKKQLEDYLESSHVPARALEAIPVD